MALGKLGNENPRFDAALAGGCVDALEVGCAPASRPSATCDGIGAVDVFARGRSDEDDSARSSTLALGVTAARLSCDGTLAVARVSVVDDAFDRD
jgi:hypothetical protein